MKYKSKIKELNLRFLGLILTSLFLSSCGGQLNENPFHSKSIFKIRFTELEDILQEKRISSYLNLQNGKEHIVNSKIFITPAKKIKNIITNIDEENRKGYLLNELDRSTETHVIPLTTTSLIFSSLTQGENNKAFWRPSESTSSGIGWTVIVENYNIFGREHVFTSIPLFSASESVNLFILDSVDKFSVEQISKSKENGIDNWYDYNHKIAVAKGYQDKYKVIASRIQAREFSYGLFLRGEYTIAKLNSPITWGSHFSIFSGISTPMSEKLKVFDDTNSEANKLILSGKIDTEYFQDGKETQILQSYSLLSFGLSSETAVELEKVSIFGEISIDDKPEFYHLKTDSSYSIKYETNGIPFTVPLVWDSSTLFLPSIINAYSTNTNVETSKKLNLEGGQGYITGGFFGPNHDVLAGFWYFESSASSTAIKRRLIGYFVFYNN